MTLPSAPATVAAWHRVDVCDSTVLARTRVSVIGVLDARAIETIDEAVAQAAENEHALTFELGGISSITPDALATLLTRGSPPDDGALDVLGDSPNSVALRPCAVTSPSRPHPGERVRH